MFGYVRPYVPNLRVRELELYRAAYCGLCRRLGGAYGLAARFALGYDFVFLALLLAEPAPPRVTLKRCPFHVKRKRCLDLGGASRKAAACAVILARHKLSDDADDERPPRRALARVGRAALTRAYGRAVADCPAFADAVANALGDLRVVESDAAAPLDAAADAFARALAAAADDVADASRRRVLQSLLYHVGRWIHILDARDDFADDTRLGRPNAIAARLNGAVVDDERLRATLNASLSAAAAALELLPESEYGGILRNIIYEGLPETQSAVFENRKEEKFHV